MTVLLAIITDPGLIIGVPAIAVLVGVVFYLVGGFDWAKRKVASA